MIDMIFYIYKYLLIFGVVRILYYWLVRGKSLKQIFMAINDRDPVTFRMDDD